MATLNKGMPNQNDHADIELTPVEARQGIMTGRILRVLIISTTLTIVVLAVIYFILT